MIKRFEYEDSKFLEYMDLGQENKKVLVINHGLLGSAKNKQLGEFFANEGIRTISIARCGYGESTFNILNNYIAFSKIVKNLLDNLNVKNFDTLGISAGAPHSYAYASYMKDRVHNVFIFSGIPAIYKQEVINAYENVEVIKQYYDFFKRSDVKGIGVKLLKDYEFAFSEEFKQTNEYKDSIANEKKGVGQEAKLQSMNWGFEIEDIKQKIYLQHSKDDDIVPFKVAQISAKYLKNAKFIEVEGFDHMSQEAFIKFLTFIIKTIKS